MVQRVEKGREFRRFRTLSLCMSDLTVEIGSRRIFLTRAEFFILEALTRRPDRLLTRDQLLDALCGDAADPPFNRSIDSHIKRLRKKGVTGIITNYGVGYLWTDAVQTLPGQHVRSGSEQIDPVVPRCAHCGAPFPG